MNKNYEQVEPPLIDQPQGHVQDTHQDSSFSSLLGQETHIATALQRLNILTPTEIQRLSLPILLAGRDAILQARTGSGKTFAFSIPLLLRLRQEQKQAGQNQTLALVVTPTRELALQIESVLKSLGSEFDPTALIGGADIRAQIRSLQQDARLVVGTPGRILDLLKQKELNLRSCRFFVVDEVDEMLSTGFLEDVRQILSRLPDRRQGVFVSATITPRVEMLAHSFLSKPERVIAQASSAEDSTTQHLYCEVGGDLMAKPSALCDLIETLRPRSAIIFCNTKSDTQLVEALLRRRGFDARRINSDLSQRQRDKVMKKIRQQELQFLVATDVAARGIDIEQLDLVVNYSIHEQPETYVHRTGRTGRAGKSGKAISLVGPRDFGYFHHLCKVLNIRLEKIPIPGDTEVADARLTHLYEILRLQEIELRDRDLLVARQFLREQGSISEPAENLELLLAKLCRSAIEHVLSAEASSLEDEEQGPENKETERQEHEQRPERNKPRTEDRPERRRNRSNRSSHPNRAE